MDVDTIIEQLERVAQYRGAGGLTEAVELAPELLRQARYAEAPDRPEAFAQDLEAAVVRLPEPTRARAKTLLPITMPEAFVKDRLGQMGLSKASATAKRWHRQAVLGRVAFELLRLDVTPSHRVVSLSVHLSQRTKSLAGGGAPYRVARIFDIRWRLERLVADLRWFAFPFPTPPGLRLHLIESSRGVNCMWSTGPAKDGSEWYMGVYPQGLPQTSASTVDFWVRLSFRPTRKAPMEFEFAPTTTIERVSISLDNALGRQPACVERDVAGAVHKKLRSRTKVTPGDDLVAHGEQPARKTTTAFIARKPHIGRHFQLTWQR